MGRTSQYIYGYGVPKPETIAHIEDILRQCSENIGNAGSVARSWEMLAGRKAGQLSWSSVMASKTLHFCCRSLGFEENPPVPIDRERIRKKLWPTFRDSIPFGERPSDWEGDSFEAYSRYMSAILAWAAQKRWTTAQIEATAVNIIDRM
jgi:hypothetical protein